METTRVCSGVRPLFVSQNPFMEVIFEFYILNVASNPFGYSPVGQNDRNGRTRYLVL
jgi:hypothetical protein